MHLDGPFYLLRAALWATCILCSWIGLGDFTLRRMQRRAWPWPLSGLAGMAIAMFAGGILNLLSRVTPTTIATLIGIGLLCFIPCARRGLPVWTAFRQSLRSSPWFVLLSVTLLLALLGLLTVNSLRFQEFNLFDDVWAYLTFPAKMLALGHLPSDPFSERRVQATLGGGYFLQCLGLVATDIRSIHFIDLGAGHIFFCAIVFYLGRSHKNSLLASTLLALLCIVVQISHTNLTYVLLPAALFVAVYLVERDPGIRPTVKSVLLGLLAGAAILLKTVSLPPLALILLGVYGYRLITHPARLATIRQFAIATLACVAGMLPWMIALQRTEGTLLYPLLGKGYEIGAYGPIPHQPPIGASGIRLGLLILAALLILALLVWRDMRDSGGTDRAELPSLFILASAISVMPIAISVGHGPLLRYVMPSVMSCLLIALAATIPTWPHRQSTRWSLADLKASSVFLFLLLCFEAKQGKLSHNWSIFRIVPSQAETPTQPLRTFDRLARERQRESIAQQSIPQGANVLAAAVPLIGVDHRRNNYLVADFPGMASLPPGMPTQQGPAALRAYLLNHAVEYILTSRINAQLIAASRDLFTARSSNVWFAMELSVSCDVQAAIDQLAATYPAVYDDGDLRVIHLR